MIGETYQSFRNALVVSETKSFVKTAIMARIDKSASRAIVSLPNMDFIIRIVKKTSRDKRMDISKRLMFPKSTRLFIVP